MYQGCNKTALCSQRNIADGFYELLCEKEYSKISVSEICKKADVSRQTFYTLFSSKENIISYILSNEYSFDPSEECHCSDTLTVENLSKGFACFIFKRAEFIKLLEQNNVIYLMADSLYDNFMNCKMIDKALGEDIPLELTARFTSAGLSAIARYYVDNKDEISVEELERIIYKLFS